MARLRVGLFGGSFNPPHVGHVLAATYVLSTAQVDRVLVVPVYEHALRKSLEPFESRLHLARAAFERISGVEVSDVEATLGAPSRTLNTVQFLMQEHPDWDLRLMVGSDILGEIHQWHAFEEVRRLAPPLVLARAGDAHADAGACLLPEVSSTEVRTLLEGRPEVGLGAAEARLKARVPAGVLELILRDGLYRDTA